MNETTPPITHAVFVTHAVATLFMVGVAWFVQVVHYPLMEFADRATYSAFAEGHSLRTGWVVTVPMLLELAGATALLFLPNPYPRGLLWLGFALVVVIWISTFFLQVPQHNRLGSGFDASAHRILVHTNWIRTLGWSLRGALVVFLWYGTGR